MDMLYWFIPWEESVLVVTAAGTLTVLFLRGCGTTHPSSRQKAYFWSGLMLLYLQFTYAT